ncbi:MAG: Mth938-like domain-containing protein [Proteobacteria bacterium]|nr:Mth938-like domain-containing protein [Pseudomonadota bacterium]
MELTPSDPGARQLIQSYGADGFTIAGRRHDGAVLVFPDRTIPWTVSDISKIVEDDLAAVLSADPPVEILLIGCGEKAWPVAPDLRARMRQAGVVIEATDTGAACRTFNVLLIENRRVAAALMPVP